MRIYPFVLILLLSLNLNARQSLTTEQLAENSGHILQPGLPEPYYMKATTPDGVEVKMTYAENYLSSPFKPTFLFVHGMTANKHNWQDGNPNELSIMDLIWKSGFETATMHYRGHGGGDQRSVAKKKPAFNILKPLDFYYPGKSGTDTASSTFYGPDRMVMDIVAAVEEIRQTTGRKVVLVGHSMGEMIPFLVLSGVRYDPEAGRSYKLTEEEALKWVKENIHSVQVKSKLIQVVLKSGKVINKKSEFSKINKTDIASLHYEHGEVINPKRGQTTYNVNMHSPTIPFNKSRKLKSEIRYNSHTGLIGIGGPSDMGTEMGKELGIEATQIQIEMLRSFLIKHEAFLNWLTSPNHNRNWWEEYQNLPLNRLRKSLRQKYFKPIMNYTMEKGEDRAFQFLADLLRENPEVDTFARRAIVGMVGPAQNFDFSTDELPQLLREGTAGMSLSVILSVMDWVAFGYGSRDRNVKYRYSVPFADILAIRGDKDITTPREIFLKHFALLQNKVRFVLMKDSGHLGLLVRQRRIQLFNAIMEFIGNPKTNNLSSGLDILANKNGEYSDFSMNKGRACSLFFH